MTAYDWIYLDEIVETQGWLFECLDDLVPGIDMDDFINRYMRSETRKWVDIAYPYVGTMNYDILYEYFVETEGFEPRFTERGFDQIALNWIGQFYARYQWWYNIPSREVIELLPLERMLRAYPGLHDLDLQVAVERVGAL